MLSDMVPFKMVGNLYFVGCKAYSSHLIDTGDGLILIDVGYEENADAVIESIGILGFDVKDIKYILLSHGHVDHSEGAPMIVNRSGAKVFMFEADNKYLNGFLPDVYLNDGDIISLGNTEILVLATPGHTEGTASFFWNVTENGKTYRAGMFGGAGTNQLKKAFMDKVNLPYRMRGEFFKSVERLKSEHVDIFVGNHTWNNNTSGKYKKSLVSDENPFINECEWVPFLEKVAKDLEGVIANEIKTEFVNYAHRGASEYCPENTMLSFYTGLYMGANGIETDVRRTKDGTLVLFHDDTLTRVTGEEGAAEDFTFDELLQFNVTKDGLSDKIVRFEDFLKAFSFRNLTFAIELKGKGVEKDTADLLRKYNMAGKTVVTSFSREMLENFKAYAPEFRLGHLTKAVTEEHAQKLLGLDIEEYCPLAEALTPQFTEYLHKLGFRVRAWGVTNEELMEKVLSCGADGMTVNFPDKLTKALARNEE